MVGVDDGPGGLFDRQADDVFRLLMPFVAARPGQDWASRWTVVLAEVERRCEVMDLPSAVASVRDDLAAERL